MKQIEKNRNADFRNSNQNRKAVTAKRDRCSHTNFKVRKIEKTPKTNRKWIFESELTTRKQARKIVVPTLTSSEQKKKMKINGFAKPESELTTSQNKAR